jgi:hypothetical protein
MIILQLQDLNLVMTTTIVPGMHTAFATPITGSFVKLE